MKHHVRLHGKKPKEKSLRRVAIVAKKKLTAADVTKGVRHGAWPTVTEALADGVDPNQVYVHYYPLIMAVAAEAPVKIVEAVLKAGADPNASNRNRETALFVASDPKIVVALLAAGADANRIARFGGTPLHAQASAGRSQAMRPLIDAGAQVNAANDDGQTPLLLAMHHAHLSTVTLLLARGADPNQTDRDGSAPLHKIIWQRSQAVLEMAHLLIKAGANVEARTRLEQHTPLMLAGTADAALLLLAAGANVNATTPTGLTALIKAVRDGELAIVRVLLQGQADAHVRVAAEHHERDLAGKTAREVAQASKSKALRALLMHPTSYAAAKAIAPCTTTNSPSSAGTTR